MRQNTKHEGQKKGSRRRRTADGRDKLMQENRNTKDKSRGGVGGQPTGGTNSCEKQKHEGQKKGWRRRTADGRDKPRREIENLKDSRRGASADSRLDNLPTLGGCHVVGGWPFTVGG